MPRLEARNLLSGCEEERVASRVALECVKWHILVCVSCYQIPQAVIIETTPTPNTFCFCTSDNSVSSCKRHAWFHARNCPLLELPECFRWPYHGRTPTPAHHSSNWKLKLNQTNEQPYLVKSLTTCYKITWAAQTSEARTGGLGAAPPET